MVNRDFYAKHFNKRFPFPKDDKTFFYCVLDTKFSKDEKDHGRYTYRKDTDTQKIRRRRKKPPQSILENYATKHCAFFFVFVFKRNHP